MGQAVPTQHPAVVLRSHFNQLRALLAVALIAVIGLTVAVVILASSDQQVSDTSPAAAIQPGNAATRSDGGPEESALAATLGTKATSVGHDESDTAAAIGSASGSSAITGSRSDSLPQEEHPLRSRVATAGDSDGPPDADPKDRRDGGNRGPGPHTH